MHTGDRLLAIGLMSGTSADGIDAALVEVRRAPRSAALLHFQTQAFPAELRERVLVAAHGRATTPDLCLLHMALGEAFGRAVLALCREAGRDPGEVDVVGCHGQTVWHAPRADPPGTLQVGAPAVIARLTGIPVVSDFRSADIAAGGQGAPLAPLVHHLLFGHPTVDRLVINLGGIANATRLPAGGGPETVTAMDVGPGNMVIDAVIHFLTGGNDGMDRDGRLASRGRAHDGLLEALMETPFFHAPAPKSTGREVFGAGFTESVLRRAKDLDLGPEDLVATVTALTARGVALGVSNLGNAPEVLLCGGGSHNPVLIGMIASLLPGARIGPTDDWGVPARAVEGLAFADLAARTVWGEPGNLPAVTGAREAVVLGSVTPGGPRPASN